ncbi:hypothetical protein N8845_00935 [Flavobacteriaceae bacterium]|nr:hypothetical protein [Flavobacteriaceae bacterium]
MKDLYLTVLILASISLNILALMMVAGLVDEFISPFILLIIGVLLFLFPAIKYFTKK